MPRSTPKAPYKARDVVRVITDSPDVKDIHGVFGVIERTQSQTASGYNEATRRMEDRVVWRVFVRTPTVRGSLWNLSEHEIERATCPKCKGSVHWCTGGDPGVHCDACNWTSHG